MTEGSRWFRRFARDCKRISPHIRLKRISNGFYRIYWRRAYIHEVYKEMPQFGHDIYERDPRFDQKKHFESKEYLGEVVREIKNYVEGYWESLGRIRTQTYMMKHDKEFNESATKAYEKVVVK